MIWAHNNNGQERGVTRDPLTLARRRRRGAGGRLREGRDDERDERGRGKQGALRELSARQTLINSTSHVLGA